MNVEIQSELGLNNVAPNLKNVSFRVMFKSVHQYKSKKRFMQLTLLILTSMKHFRILLRV